MVCETPNYPSNYGIPQGLGMETSLCSMDFEDGYKLNLDKIKARHPVAVCASSSGCSVILLKRSHLLRM